MFSRDKAIHPSGNHLPDISEFIDNTFKNFIISSELCAGFLCQWNEDNSDIIPLSAYGIPLEPFHGSKKDSLRAYIIDCLNIHPTPHVHSIAKHQLWTDISSLKDIALWHPKAIFLPSFVGDLEFILICFGDKSQKFSITKKIINSAFSVVLVSGFILSANNLNDRIRVMEIYVREVGHDIASSVQAIIAKLRNIRLGLIQGPAVIEKVREAEDEIMATYRVADTLGITVDPDYNIGSGNDFDVASTVMQVVQLCQSEASERHVELIVEFPENNIQLWGDEKAIQSAIMQLLINAIKYAFGSSFVTIRVEESQDRVSFSVTDKGMPLAEEDKAHIWEFGWRGEKAKELHVNGSGIGLFTVNKVARAHGGSTDVKVSRKDDGVITFFIQIPKKHVIKKYSLAVKSY